MFLGHFGVALAAKKVAPRPALGTTIMAAQWADGVWPIFVLLGLEHVEIKPGATRVTPLDFVSYPYTHGLVADIGWAALFASFLLVLAILYLASVFGPPPPSEEVLAVSGLAGWLFAAWGYWIERHRVTETSALALA